jgi:hypothetical protein
MVIRIYIYTIPEKLPNAAKRIQQNIQREQISQYKLVIRNPNRV